jgi:WD40 repeat protein
LAILSKDFIISFWEVGSWKYKSHIKAYHESHAKFYLKDLKVEERMDEFDISVFAFNDGCNLLVSGLFNGMIQFWDLTRSLLSVEIPSHLAEVTQLVFNYDQSILVSSGADYLINVWNAQERQLMFEIRE